MAFVVVKYGANEEKLVNPNCLCAVLLNHVKKTCGFTELIENIDLASESGEVMDLVSKPREYARKFLEPRSNYILVKVVGDESDESSPTYMPLLDQTGDKIKFSVTNPTFRLRTKGKAGTKGEAPKVDKTEEVQQAQAVKASKAAAQVKTGKADKADAKGSDKAGGMLGAAQPGGDDSFQRRSVAPQTTSNTSNLAGASSSGTAAGGDKRSPQANASKTGGGTTAAGNAGAKKAAK
ncbi:hypothetical protein BC831DRAFT_472347 [Entophlyctis helioformis]|nr:hypothetical protein BC831DRAFT_472347 [Entophlyctis helioformis]